MARKRMKKRKKPSWKVGQTKVKIRKVDGRKRRVRVTKLSRGRYRVRAFKGKKRK